MTAPDPRDVRAAALTTEAACVRVQLLDAVAALEAFIARLDAEVARRRHPPPPTTRADGEESM